MNSLELYLSYSHLNSEASLILQHLAKSEQNQCTLLVVQGSGKSFSCLDLLWSFWSTCPGSSFGCFITILFATCFFWTFCPPLVFYLQSSWIFGVVFILWDQDFRVADIFWHFRFCSAFSLSETSSSPKPFQFESFLKKWPCQFCSGKQRFSKYWKIYKLSNLRNAQNTTEVLQRIARDKSLILANFFRFGAHMH